MRHPFEANSEAFTAGIHLKNEKLIEMLGVHVIQVMKSKGPRKEYEKVENMKKSSEDNLEKRRRRIRIFEAHLDRAKAIVNECKTAWNVPFDAYMLRRRFERSKTEKRVANLLLRGYGELKSEVNSVCAEHTSYESILTEKNDIRRVVAEFELFFAHLERETNGGVKVDRLLRNTERYERCEKAVVGNIRPEHRAGCKGFENVKGLEVCNIFKIRHAPILSAFKRKMVRLGKAANTKGLFCSVSAQSLENLFSFGMLGSEMSGGDESEKLFKGSWFERCSVGGTRKGGSGENDSPAAPAETRALNSSAVSFPRIFSRFSSFRGSVPNRREQQQVMYVVLCRVILNKPFVLSKSARKFPKITDEMRDAFDAIYAPALDEYLLFEPRNVVPEFVFQCRWTVACTDLDTTTHGKSTLPALRDIVNVYEDREVTAGKDLERCAGNAGRPSVFSRVVERRKVHSSMRQHFKSNAPPPAKGGRDARPLSRYRRHRGGHSKRTANTTKGASS